MPEAEARLGPAEARVSLLLGNIRLDNVVPPWEQWLREASSVHSLLSVCVWGTQEGGSLQMKLLATIGDTESPQL